MARLKRILTDPSFYGIIALNIYFIFEFQRNRSQYDTIIWLYLAQSIIIGFFNFLEISTTKKFAQEQPATNSFSGQKGCNTGFFFLIHYSFFHLVYILFLGKDIGFKGIDFNFFKTAILCVFLSQLVFFVQHKFTYRDHPPKLGLLFIQPYARIIPMHLTIMLPSFIGVQPSLVFIILRGIMDLVGYVITAPWFQPPAGYNKVLDALKKRSENEKRETDGLP